MTRVDFHSNVPGKLAYACRLVRKAYGAGQKVIVVGDQAALQAFDTQLWTFSQLDFLPHCGLRHPLAAQTPILLADATEPLDDAPHHDILVNLSPEPQRWAPADPDRWRTVTQTATQGWHFDGYGALIAEHTGEAR